MNFILDEFGNFVQIPDFSNKLTVGGGRGIRFNLYLQSFAQLDEKYGKEVAKTIKGNCENWIYLQSYDLETLDEISKKLGNYTVSTYSLSASHGKYSTPSSSHSINLTHRVLNEKKILKEKEYLSRKDLEYVNKRLESEKKNGNWMSRRIQELEYEVGRLKNRPLWKQILDDFKLKPKWRPYNRKRKFYEFMEKIFHVLLAVVFTIIVFVAVYWFMKWSMHQ